MAAVEEQEGRWRPYDPQEWRWDKARIGNVMQPRIASIDPEVPIAELEAFLAAEEISGAPVIDAHGNVLGIVSQTDIIQAHADEPSTPLRELLAPDLRVKEIMTSEVFSVDEDDDVASVARRMADARVHRALVMGRDGVVGIVTTFDLLRCVR